MKSRISIIPDRIEIIDILRGFALLGIVLTHFIDHYFGGTIPVVKDTSTTDHFIKTFVVFFIDGKFYSIFSFLFGISFFIQLRNKNDTNFLFRFLWRLFILLIIGLLHHLHYRADILSTYALVGFLLVICYRLPDKYLFVVGIIFAANAPATLYHSLKIAPVQKTEVEPTKGPKATTSGVASHEEIYFKTLKYGSYPEILKANVAEILPRLKFRMWSGKIFMIFGLFLLGYLVGKQGIFENVNNYIRPMRNVLYASVVILVICMLFRFRILALSGLTDRPGYWVLNSLNDISNLLMATVYVTSLALVYQISRGRAVLMVFSEIGRMGLTTYLFQTFFGFILFFGFNMLGELSHLQSFLAALVVFALQIVLSRAWLKRFRYGIFEWAWRSLTYLKVVGFKK